MSRAGRDPEVLDLDMAERARLLADRELWAIHDEHGWDSPTPWTQADASALAATMLKQSQPRQRLAPLMTAALHLALLVSYYLSEGYGGIDAVEEALEGETGAAISVPQSRQRPRLRELAEEIAPLAQRFSARAAASKSSWSDPPGYCYRLREAAVEAAAIAAVRAARDG
jgi:hypothetical protein